jgi:hypothetical protein
MGEFKKKEDKEIIEEVIHALRLNKKKLAEELEYKSHMSIYYVADGVNKLSDDMINRIMIRFPEVNYLFLKTGEGTVLNTKVKQNQQENIFNIKNKKKTPFEDFADLPERVNRIEEKLDLILNHLNIKKPS